MKTAASAVREWTVKGRLVDLKIMVAAAVCLLGSGMATAAHAGMPLAPDLITPPPNINVGMIYNQFSTADSFYTADGTKIGGTRVTADTPILRYVHTFSPIRGINYGIQVIAPYTVFVGNQRIGGQPFSSNSGFAEPILSAFAWPISDPAHDQYLNFTYYVSPPAGAFSSSANLNAGTNNWVNNIEVGYGHILLGSPKAQRLDFEIWGDAYFYSENNSYGSSAFLGREKLHTQAAEQIIAYLPYYFHPETAAYIGLGFEQTFGGKQTVSFSNVPNLIIDTGERNDVTSVSLIAGSFVASTVFVNAEVGTDVRVRGGPRNATSILFNIGKIF